ncbi:MAG: YidH family protein [Leptolyngbyaceae cyanobacterium]
MDSTPPKLTGPNNELAKERNRAAAERTMTAWIQNCLTLIGFGIVVDQISLALFERSQSRDVLIGDGFAPILALGFIVFGIGLLGVALVQHHIEVKSIEQDDYVLQSVSELNNYVVGAILLFGFMSLIAIFLAL